MTSVPGDIGCVGQNSPFLPAFALSLAAHGSKLMYHKSSEASLRAVLGGAAVVVHEDYPRSYSKIQYGQSFFFPVSRTLATGPHPLSRSLGYWRRILSFITNLARALTRESPWLAPLLWYHVPIYTFFFFSLSPSLGYRRRILSCIIQTWRERSNEKATGCYRCCGTMCQYILFSFFRSLARLWNTRRVQARNSGKIVVRIASRQALPRPTVRPHNLGPRDGRFALELVHRQRCIVTPR